MNHPCPVLKTAFLCSPPDTVAFLFFLPFLPWCPLIFAWDGGALIWTIHLWLNIHSHWLPTLYKLWVSALTIVHHKRNLLWPKLRAAQIYRYKYFKVRLTTWPISETSPVASFLGPMIWVVLVPDMTSICHIFLQDPCVLVRKHFLYHPKLPTPH